MLKNSRQTDLLDLSNYVPFYIATVTYRMARNASREFPPRFGVNQMEWTVMAIVAIRPGISVSGVSVFVALDKAAISRSIKELQSKGHLRSDSVQTHNRKRELSLTDQGWALYKRIQAFVLKREKKLLHGLSDAEVALLLKLLRKVHTNSAALDKPSSQVPARSRSS